MDEIKMTTVTVRTYKETNDDCPPENLYEFIAEMHLQLEKVPAEFRADTQILFRHYHDYDDCQTSIIGITYDRPETPEEAVEKQRVRADEIIRDIEWLEKRVEMLRQNADSAGVDLAEHGVREKLMKALA